MSSLRSVPDPDSGRFGVDVVASLAAVMCGVAGTRPSGVPGGRSAQGSGATAVSIRNTEVQTLATAPSSSTDRSWTSWLSSRGASPG